MHYSKYRIYLENSKGFREHLDYELYDSPITYKWMAATLYALENGLPIWGQSLNCRPTEEYATQLFERMKSLIEETNSLGKVKIDAITEKSFKDLKQKRLNHLHQQFHLFEEAVVESGKYDQTRFNLQEMNVLIHRLENTLGNLSGDPTYYEQSLLFYYKGQRRVLLEPSDYEYFVGENLFGDLLLGYGTTGKNLYQCYLNNDKDLVQNKLVRPQRTVSTEVLLIFPSHDPAEGYFEEEQAKMIKWAKSISAPKYGYNLKDPININFGHPKLGALIGSYSNDDIFYLLSNYSKVPKAELL